MIDAAHSAFRDAVVADGTFQPHEEVAGVDGLPQPRRFGGDEEMVEKGSLALRAAVCGKGVHGDGVQEDVAGCAYADTLDKGAVAARREVRAYIEEPVRAPHREALSVYS